MLGPPPAESAKIRIGINGFGRIGRRVSRRVLCHHRMELVAVNDPWISDDDLAQFANGIPPAEFPDIKLFHAVEPENIPWGRFGADYIVESSGIFTVRDAVAAHLKGGAKKVVICALSKDAPTFVHGVNQDVCKSDIVIVSIADCVTICLGLLAKVIHSRFGNARCHMITTEPSPATKDISDDEPSNSTEVAKALGAVLPDLLGKFNILVSYAPQMRLSSVNMTVWLDKPADYEIIKSAMW